jgi:hypothetical protein
MASMQTGGASRSTRTVTLTPSCPQSSHRGTQSRGDELQFRKLTQSLAMLKRYASVTTFYDQAHQFEPLLPSALRQEPLLAKAHDLAMAATALAGQPIAKEMRGLLRAMNSYYTNRIEGQHTRPHELEQALRQDFSKDAHLAARQRLAIAHIDAEVALEARYAGNEGAKALYGLAAIRDIHRALFVQLPDADLSTGDGAVIVPGEIRSREVSVGRHVAPAARDDHQVAVHLGQSPGQSN